MIPLYGRATRAPSATTDLAAIRRSRYETDLAWSDPEDPVGAYLALLARDARARKRRRHAGNPEGALALAVAETEKAAITEALRKTRGSPTRAARLLGVSVRTLHYRLTRYRLHYAGETAQRWSKYSV